jgi:hypothetical protein
LAKLGGGSNPRCKVIGGQGSAEAKYPDSAPDGKRQSWDSTAFCVSGSVRYRAICRPKHLDLGTYPSVTGGFSWGLRSVATRDTVRSMPHTHQMELHRSLRSSPSLHVCYRPSRVVVASSYRVPEGRVSSWYAQKSGVFITYNAI